MANRRSVWKKISLCAQLADVSERAALLYTWAIPHADDWGVIDANPRILKGMVFPLRDDLSAPDVEAARDELVGAGLVVLYTHGGREWLHYPTWEEHQSGLHKRTEKNRLPLPGDTGSEAAPSGNFPEPPGNDGKVPPKRSRSEVKRSEGKDTTDVAAPPPAVVTAETPEPPDPFYDLYGEITQRLQPGAGRKANIRLLPKDTEPDEATAIRERWMKLDRRLGRERLLNWVAAANARIGRAATLMGHLAACEERLKIDGARAASDAVEEDAEAEAKRVADLLEEDRRRRGVIEVVEEC